MKILFAIIAVLRSLLPTDSEPQPANVPPVTALLASNSVYYLAEWEDYKRLSPSDTYWSSTTTSSTVAGQNARLDGCLKNGWWSWIPDSVVLTVALAVVVAAKIDSGIG